MREVRPAGHGNKTKKPLHVSEERLFPTNRDPAGIRTQDPYIKSVLLYQLSYRILYFATGVCYSLIVAQK